MTRLSYLFFSTAIAVMAVSVAMPAAAQGSVIEIQGEVVASCTAVAPTIPVNLGQINSTVNAEGNETRQLSAKSQYQIKYYFVSVNQDVQKIGFQQKPDL